MKPSRKAGREDERTTDRAAHVSQSLLGPFLARGQSADGESPGDV